MEDNSEYPKWKIFLDLGRRNLDMEDNISAINALRKSIEIKDTNHLPFLYKGMANNRLGKFQEAINDFTKSLEIKEDVNSYIERGRAFNSLGNYKRALIDLNFAHKLIRQNSKFKNSSELFHNRGITYYGLKKFRNSVIDLSKAIKLKADDFFVFNNRGWAYFRLENWNKANADWIEAIKRNPENKYLLICYEQLSLINIKLQNYKEVIKLSEKGYALSFEHHSNLKRNSLSKEEIEIINSNWLVYLGFANIKLNDYEQAEYWLDKVNFLYMDRPDTRACELLCRSFALIHLDKYEEALDYFDKALRVKKVFDWNFIFSEIEELLDELPDEMKSIIRIEFQYKFNK